MKAKLLSTLAASALFVLGGVASANEPVTLNETQMDAVTAAGTGFATAGAIAVANALGTVLHNTATNTTASVWTIQLPVAVPPGSPPSLYDLYIANSHSDSTANAQ